AEAAARAQELETTFQTITDGIAVYDADMHMVSQNSAIRALIDFTRFPGYNELPLEDRARLSHARDGNGEPMAAADSPPARVLRGEILDGTNAMDLQMLTPDGRDLFFNVTGAPIRDEQGNIVKAILVYRDMTSRRQLERRTQEAIEATRMKSEFLANMSHELRTPLNGIIGFAELMHDGKVGPISEDHQEYLGDILTSARHLQQLINDVLDLAKVEAGKMIFRPEPIDLSRLAGEVNDVVRPLAANRQIAVEMAIDPTLTDIEVDPSKLKQVLYNYISNAIKFTPENGKVIVRALPDGDEGFRIEVEDSGIGIKPDDLQRLFVEFRQLDSTSAKRYQGTGLGLALTKRIIEAQEGRVGVRSDYGRGSIFWATLPRVVKTTVEDRVEFKNQLSLTRANAPTVLI
ncbi:MAG TPA: ATP-binding protein, partial [Ktedonobacterales bacterium]|nr:ATP-binding protein [Ktedonobacterales bacterium]